MIDKRYGKFALVCDFCGEESEEVTTFQDAVDLQHRLRWVVRKEAGEWLDLCTDCGKVD